MDTEKLKDSVRGIQMREEMKEAVIADVKRRTAQTTDDHKRSGAGWRKNLAAAALVLAAVSAAAFPVSAFVDSLVKERMERMPQAEKDAYVENIKNQMTEADGFTRA